MWCRLPLSGPRADIYNHIEHIVLRSWKTSEHIFLGDNHKSFEVDFLDKMGCHLFSMFCTSQRGHVCCLQISTFPRLHYGEAMSLGEMNCPSFVLFIIDLTQSRNHYLLAIGICLSNRGIPGPGPGILVDKWMDLGLTLGHWVMEGFLRLLRNSSLDHLAKLPKTMPPVLPDQCGMRNSLFILTLGVKAALQWSWNRHKRDREGRWKEPSCF